MRPAVARGLQLHSPSMSMSILRLVLSIDQVWSVRPCGVIVHSNTVNARIECGIFLGLSGARQREIQIAAGQVQTGDFNCSTASLAGNTCPT